MPDPGLSFDPCDAAQRDERLHHFFHALKNRLGSLWQAAILLHDLPMGPEREQLLVLAEKSYFNGAHELEDLMDDFAVPRGITTLQRNEVALGPLLEECINNISFRTSKKEQVVRFQPDEQIVVNGDHDILRQLFEALLSNASKFSPKGALILVEAKSEAEQVHVLVEDQGVGLTEDDITRIFQRYVILSTRATDGESQARGTLARAKHWAEAHGGSIDAISEGQGKGSTFNVRLPKASL